MEKKDSQEKNLAQFWTDFLREEFEHETDRGAVVLTASLLENALTNILKKHLVPSSSTDDELFDRPLSPLSSFNSKIQIAQRLGLVSIKLARDLNLMRKMRNEFAHNVHGSSFDSGKIKELLTNLTKSSGIVKGHEGLTFYPPGTRGEFLKVSHITLFHLQSMIDNPALAAPLQMAEEEWIYKWKYTPPETTNQSQIPNPRG